jgi:hypothetical protein
MALAARRLNKRTAVVLAIAAGVSVAILVAALSVVRGGGTEIVGSTLRGPITVAEPGTTFVHEAGRWGPALVGYPLLATLVVASALWLRSPARRGPGPYAVTAAALLALESLLGILTIGVFVFPVAVALVFASATFQDFRVPRPAAGRVGRP